MKKLTTPKVQLPFSLTLKNMHIMNSIKNGLATTMAFLLFSTIAFGQVAPECNTSNATKVRVPPPSNPITASSRTLADNAYRDYVEDNLGNWSGAPGGYYKAKCPKCPDETPEGCTISNVNITDIPVPVEGGNNQYTYGWGTVTVQFSCSQCTEKEAKAQAHTFPSYSTTAMCDGNMNMTHLFVPAAFVDPMNASTPEEAKEVWLEWITTSNGEGFDASTPWGCPECQTFPGQACPMWVDPAMSTPVPDPIMENGRWLFQPMPTFTLVYNCNGCQPQTRLATPQLEDDLILSIYPNPAQDLLNIEVSEAVGAVGQIKINDLLGRQQFLQTEGINVSSGVIQVDVSNLPSGNYLLELQLASGKTTTSKITINK